MAGRSPQALPGRPASPGRRPAARSNGCGAQTDGAPAKGAPPATFRVAGAPAGRAGVSYGPGVFCLAVTGAACARAGRGRSDSRCAHRSGPSVRASPSASGRGVTGPPRRRWKRSPCAGGLKIGVAAD